MSDQTPLTVDQRAAIRRRAEAATPGPWRTWPDGTEESVESESVGRFVCHLNSNMRQFREDAAFIAHAREDISRLLATVDAAERLLHDLTPGGSEFFANPKRCAEYVRERLESAQRLTVRAYTQRNEAERERDAALAREAALRAAIAPIFAYHDESERLRVPGESAGGDVIGWVNGVCLRRSDIGRLRAALAAGPAAHECREPALRAAINRFVSTWMADGGTPSAMRDRWALQIGILSTLAAGPADRAPT